MWVGRERERRKGNKEKEEGDRNSYFVMRRRGQTKIDW